MFLKATVKRRLPPRLYNSVLLAFPSLYRTRLVNFETNLEEGASPGLSPLPAKALPCADSSGPLACYPHTHVSPRVIVVKYRLAEILACPACGGRLAISPAQVEEDTHAPAGLAGPRCRAFCTFQGLDLSRTATSPGQVNCSGCYSREIISGNLDCEGCGRAYPIEEGVPVLLTERSEDLRDVEDSFSYEWSSYEYSSLTWEMDLDVRKKLVPYYLQVGPEDLDGALILDAGCGNATLTAVMSHFGADVVGMDLSTSVHRAQRLKRDFAPETAHLVHFVRANVMAPPFRDASFDYLYSDGVLHHTPDTKTSFMAIAPLVKEDGRFFVWLYDKDVPLRQRPKQVAVAVLQPLTSRLPHRLLFAACYTGAALLLGALRVRRSLGDSSRPMIPLRLKAVNLFDTFSPRFNHLHRYSEVSAWFREAGFPHTVELQAPERAAGLGFGALGSRTKPG